MQSRLSALINNFERVEEMRNAFLNKGYTEKNLALDRAIGQDRDSLLSLSSKSIIILFLSHSLSSDQCCAVSSLTLPCTINWFVQIFQNVNLDQAMGALPFNHSRTCIHGKMEHSAISH